jgi:hypothetical protein
MYFNTFRNPLLEKVEQNILLEKVEQNIFLEKK